MYLQTRSIMASKFAQSWPPSASPNSLDHSLQVPLQTHSITAFKCIFKLTRLRPPSASPKSLDHGLQLHLQPRSIPASQVHLQTCSITSSKVHLQIRSTTGLECISEFTRLSFSRALRIALKHCLQPVQIYRV